MHILTNIFKLSPNSNNTLEPIQDANTCATELLIAEYQKEAKLQTMTERKFLNCIVCFKVNDQYPQNLTPTQTCNIIEPHNMHPRESKYLVVRNLNSPCCYLSLGRGLLVFRRSVLLKSSTVNS